MTPAMKKPVILVKMGETQAVRKRDEAAGGITSLVRDNTFNTILYELQGYVAGCFQSVCVFTSHISDVMGVIVLTSCVCVCLSVCPSVSLYRPKGKTYRLEFLHGGQVEGYLG